MFDTSLAYKEEINKPSRQFKCRITIGNVIFDNDNLVSSKFEFSQPTDGFQIGNTISQSLDLTLLNEGYRISTKSKIKFEIGLLLDNNEIEYVLMGIYNIDEIEKTDHVIKITAFDNMVKFETPFNPNLSNNPTLEQLVKELADKSGVEFEGDLPAYETKKPNGFTCREVLSYVASLCGGNAFITRNGKFTIKTLNEVDKTINSNNYFTYTTEEDEYKIGKITCQIDDEKEISKGKIEDDSFELEFQNPWITEKIITDIYNKLKESSYLGYSLKFQGDLSLDPYDIITIKDKNNVIRKVPILSQTLNFNGGLTAEIGAKGQTKNKNNFQTNGTTETKINRFTAGQTGLKEKMYYYSNGSVVKVGERYQSICFINYGVDTRTNLMLYVNVFLECEEAGKATIKIIIDNYTHDFSPSIDLEPGSRGFTFTYPLISVPEGVNHSLELHLSMGKGSAEIKKEFIQVMLKGQGISGGLSGERPHAEITEIVDFDVIKDTDIIRNSDIIIKHIAPNIIPDCDSVMFNVITDIDKNIALEPTIDILISSTGYNRTMANVALSYNTETLEINNGVMKFKDFGEEIPQGEFVEMNEFANLKPQHINYVKSMNITATAGETDFLRFIINDGERWYTINEEGQWIDILKDNVAIIEYGIDLETLNGLSEEKLQELTQDKDGIKLAWYMKKTKLDSNLSVSKIEMEFDTNL